MGSHSCAESSEHTELTRKMGTDSQTESRLTASRRGGERVGGLSEEEEGPLGMDSRGGCRVGRGCKGTKWQWQKIKQKISKKGNLR